jgi:hypothetical protein
VKRLATAALIAGGMLAASVSTAGAADSYQIEAAVNDEKFIINSELFQAQLYCLGWSEGDRVIFVEGSPLGVCVSATLFNVDRRDTCEVWCE